MNFNDVEDVANQKKLDWKRLTLQPFIYGAIFGTALYVGSLFIRSPLCTDLLEVAKNRK